MTKIVAIVANDYNGGKLYLTFWSSGHSPYNNVLFFNTKGELSDERMSKFFNFNNI